MTTPIYRRRSEHWATGRMLTSSLLALLLALGLLTLTSLGASADTNPCPDGQVIMPGTNKCVPEDILNPAPVPADSRDDGSDTVRFAVVDTDQGESVDENNGFADSDVPVAMDDEIEAAPEEPQPETVSVSVRKMECLVPVHAISDDIGALSQVCVDPMGGVQFHLIQGGLNKPNWTNANGFVSWHDVALDVYSIVEKVPAGYGEPIVFCRIDVGNSPWVKYEVTGGGNERLINMELDTPGADFLCSWYNVQPDNPGSITINKRLCPAEYDFLDAGANPELDCVESMDGVAFTLHQPFGPDVTSHTGDAFLGAVTFDDLLSGEYAVSETLPPGIAVGFVMGCPGVAHIMIPAYTTTSGEPFKLEVKPGQEIVCDWYNIPGEQDDPEEPEDEPNTDDNPGGKHDDVPVWKLPNTGTGSAPQFNGASDGASLLVASVVAMLFMLTWRTVYNSVRTQTTASIPTNRRTESNVRCLMPNLRPSR